MFNLSAFIYFTIDYIYVLLFAFLLFIRLAVDDGCSVGCQPSWDATVTP